MRRPGTPRRARHHENLHMPSTRASPGPHIHLPRRRLVLRHRGIRGYFGDSVASRRELLDPDCVQAIVFGHRFVETYLRRLDARLLGAYHAAARPLCERPLFAIRGWRRQYPVVAASLDAAERNTRRVLRSMCRTYSAYGCRARENSAANEAVHRRWFGHGAARSRRARLQRRARNRAARRRVKKRKRFCNSRPL
ncbi:NF-kappaB inhibitor [Bovine papular stomatitis virus]